MRRFRGFASCVLIAVAWSVNATAQDDLLLREALKADQRMYDNFQAFAKDNRAKILKRLDKSETSITHCEEPFPVDEFPWSTVPQFVEQAFGALGVDRDAEIRVDVERPNKCGPVHAPVSLEKSSRINGVYFDRSGRVVRVD